MFSPSVVVALALLCTLASPRVTGQLCTSPPTTSASTYGLTGRDLWGSGVYTTDVLSTKVDVDYDCDGRHDAIAFDRYGMTVLPSSAAFVRDMLPATQPPGSSLMPYPGCPGAAMGPVGMMPDVWAAPYFVSHATTSYPSFYVHDGYAGDLNGDNIPDLVIGGSYGLDAVRGVADRPYPVYVGDVPLPDYPSSPIFSSREHVLKDVDGDGDADLMFALFDNGVSLVWRENDGNGAFSIPASPIVYEPVSTYFVQHMDVALVNGDAWPDVVYITSNRDVYVHHASGPGVFSAASPAVLVTTSSTLRRSSIYEIRFFDYDNDGDLDILFSSSSSDIVAVYPNAAASPAANFAPTGTIVTLASSTNYMGRFAVGDVNLDTFLDIAVVTLSSDSVLYVRNNGDSTFTTTTAVSISYPRHVALGDIDGDSDLDICGCTLNVVFCSLFDAGSGVFTGTLFEDSPTGLTSENYVALEDLTGDGRLDLLIMSSATENALVYYENLAAFSTIFQLDRPAAFLTDLADIDYQAAIGDTNGDGVVDFVVQLVHYNTTAMASFVTGGPGSSIPGSPLPSYPSTTALTTTSSDVHRIQVLDVDGDGDRDVVFVEEFSNAPSQLRIIRNQHADSGALPGAPLDFESVNSIATIANAPVSGTIGYALEIVDLGNGRDIVVAWDGPGVFGEVWWYAVPDWLAPESGVISTRLAGELSEIRHIVFRDVDGDGLMDLVANTGPELVLFHAASSVWSDFAASATRLSLAVIDGPHPAAYFEFTQLNPAEDTMPDILINDNVRNHYPFFGVTPRQASAVANTSFTTFHPTAIDTTGYRFVVTDYDGDTFADVIYGSTSGFHIMYNLGFREATKAVDVVMSSSPNGFGGSTIVDINSDSVADIVAFATTGTSSSMLYLFLDAPAFEIADATAIDMSALGVVISSVVAADITLDGLPDLVVTSKVGDFVAWMPNTGEPPYFELDGLVMVGNITTTNSALNGPDNLAVVLLNDDLLPDIVTLPLYTRKLMLFLGDAASATGFDAGSVLADLSTLCSSPDRRVLSVDMTGDRLLDFVVSCSNRVLLVPSIGGLPWAMASAVVLASPPSLTAIQLVDLNRDGALDLAYTTGTEGEGLLYAMNMVPFGAGLPSFGPPRVVPLEVNWGRADSPGYSTRSSMTYPLTPGNNLIVADVDMDGWDDLMYMSSLTYSRVTIVLNQSPVASIGVFNDSSSMLGPSRLSSNMPWHFQAVSSLRNIRDVHVADIDADGFPDMVASGISPSYNLVYTGMQSTWRATRAPATFRVETDKCGFSLACVTETIALRTGKCLFDTVVLPTGTYSGCPTEEPYLIGRSLRLLGEDAGAVFDCRHSGMLFRVADVGVQLTLENVEIRNAKTSSTRFGGAAIDVEGGSLVLRNVTITNSTALTANQLSVSSPVIGFGGAILLRGAASLHATSVVFSHNSAGHSGGAVALVGSAIEVVFDNVVCEHNEAIISGGCLFVEAGTGPSSVSIVNSRIESNSAIGSEFTSAAEERGGGLVFIVLQSVLSVSVRASLIAHNAAAEVGGGVFLRASDDARVVFDLDDTVLSGNGASSGDGGGIRGFTLESGVVDVVLGPAAVLSGNAAAGSGGAISLSLSTLAEADASCSVTSAPGARLVDNSADIHGGAIAVSGRTSHVTLNGAVVADNFARRLGGGVAVLGGASGSVLGGSVRANTAAFGGGVAAARAAGYMSGGTSGSESASSSLPAETRDGPTTCSGRGGVTVTGAEIVGNAGVYGSVGFACGSPVILTDVSTYSFDAAARYAGTEASSGLLFTCAPAMGLCSSGVDPCCLDSSRSELLGAPWLSVDDASMSAFNDSLGLVAGSVGYGALVAMPVTSLGWEAEPPATVSSGTPFGSGRAVVSIRDGLGQAVSDAQVAIEFSFPSAATETRYAFVGAGRQQLAGEATISFESVGVAVREGTSVGESVEVQVTVAKSAMDATTAPGTVIAASLEVQACLPGAGVLPKVGSGVLECALCAEGTYSNETSLAGCTVCPSSTVLTGVGATECLFCPANTQIVPGFVPVPGSGINCTCIPGTWTQSGRLNVACDECPLGGRCAGGLAPPVSLPGYFPTEDPGVFLECPNAGACRGGYPFACAEGYTGQLCGACARGYYVLGGACYKCDNRTIPLLFLVFVLAVCFVGFLVWLNAREELSYRFAAVMIGFNSLQISAMYGKMELEWPDFAAQFFNVVSFFNLNFDLSSPECATVTDDVWLLKWWLTVSLPLLFCLPFAIVITCTRVYQSVIAPKLGRTVEMTMAMLLDACRRSYLQLMVLLYLPLAAMAMSYMQCRRDKDGRWVLEAAPAKSCYGVWYWNYFWAAVFFCAAYCLGIPGVVFWLLTRLRKKNDDMMFALRYAFLVGRFKEKNYRFEVWIMIRKVSVVIAMTFFRAAETKANAALMALMASFAQLVRFEPYAAPFHNWLAVVCLASCVCILWAGTFGESEARHVAAITAIGVNILAIVVGNIVDFVLVAWHEKDVGVEFEMGAEANELVMTTFDSVDTSAGDECVVVKNLVYDPSVDKMPGGGAEINFASLGMNSLDSLSMTVVEPATPTGPVASVEPTNPVFATTVLSTGSGKMSDVAMTPPPPLPMRPS
ncbi:SxtP protein [Thecamonas trahens ATCC 50062]|uniref:SxtP protein n=1 Tax=Thecamonas trahens ATCC 50062 TaxID=461836 RepID=A0A0L0D6S0_THETB|nr:SxtP protein [Thecamonas trahens ATCC 50062]KNC47900.1 SxtP protein [Thecamonas trahens ATCC 50062]|eukprot:XP_013758922.1 SxtP protein [Thecamonas trahens ATCC 50062]